MAGTSYFGPVAGHGLLSHDLELIRMQRRELGTERSGVVGGDVEAIPSPEDADNYVTLKKKENVPEKSD